MENKKHLGEIEEGDEVYCSAGYYDCGRILKVTKVTQTMIICGNSRFRKNGHLVGGMGWNQEIIRILTDEFRQKVRHSILSSNVQKFNFEILDIRELEKVWEIIKIFKKRKEITLPGSKK